MSPVPLTRTGPKIRVKRRTDDIDEGLLVGDSKSESGVDVLEVEGKLWRDCWCHGVNDEKMCCDGKERKKSR